MAVVEFNAKLSTLIERWSQRKTSDSNYRRVFCSHNTSWKLYLRGSKYRVWMENTVYVTDQKSCRNGRQKSNTKAPRTTYILHYERSAVECVLCATFESALFRVRYNSDFLLFSGHTFRQKIIWQKTFAWKAWK